MCLQAWLVWLLQAWLVWLLPACLLSPYACLSPSSTSCAIVAPAVLGFCTLRNWTCHTVRYSAAMSIVCTCCLPTNWCSPVYRMRFSICSMFKALLSVMWSRAAGAQGVLSVQEIRVSAATKQSCVSLAVSLGKPTSKARSIAVRGPSARQVTIPHCILQPLFEVAHLTVMFNCPWHGCIMLCDNQRIILQDPEACARCDLWLWYM